MRQNKLVTRGLVTALGRTYAIGGISIEKHRITFHAESPLSLLLIVFTEIVWQDEIISGGMMGSLGGAYPFARISVEEHRLALIAKRPKPLPMGVLGDVMR